jgi:hypothetical protein
MKNANTISLAIKAVLLLCVSTLFSFSEHVGVGGDSYSIHLNDRLLLQHYVHSKKELAPIGISENAVNDMLRIRYSHCGKIGTSRSIAVTDEQNNVLKQIHFPDASGETALSMTMKINDIVALRKGNINKRVRLLYSSKELEGGLVLATLVIGDETKASLK